MIDSQTHEQLALVAKIAFYLVLIILSIKFVLLIIPFAGKATEFHNHSYQITFFATLFLVLQIFTITKSWIIEKIDSFWARKAWIADEKRVIEQLLCFNFEHASLEQIQHHAKDIESVRFCEKILRQYGQEWKDHCLHTKRLLSEKEAEVNLSKLKREETTVLQSIKNLQEEKRVLALREKDKADFEKRKFFKDIQAKIYYYTDDLNPEQVKWLLEEGYKKDHQWSLAAREVVEIYIKPRTNEGSSHAYLIGALKEFIQASIDPKVKIYQTKMPDLVFTLDRLEWAIEVETGSVLEKSKGALEYKVQLLKKHFKDRWFFVVANKNLLQTYRKFGPAVDRSKVIEHIESIVNPDKIDLPPPSESGEIE